MNFLLRLSWLFWEESPNKAMLGSNTKVIDGQKVFQKLGFHDFDLDNLYDDVIQYLSSVNPDSDLSEGITGAIYFEGDFNESVEYVEKLVDSLSTDDDQYNLYFNNCLQASVVALEMGTFEKYDDQYKQALMYAFSTTIPNTAYAAMLMFTARIDEYMEKNWFQRIFSLSPYSAFPTYEPLGGMDDYT